MCFLRLFFIRSVDAIDSRFFSIVSMSTICRRRLEELFELLGFSRRQRSRLWPNSLGESRQHPGVDAVRLGQDARGFREIAHLPRIDHRDGDFLSQPTAAATRLS